MLHCLMTSKMVISQFQTMGSAGFAFPKKNILMTLVVIYGQMLLNKNIFLQHSSLTFRHFISFQSGEMR